MAPPALFLDNYFSSLFSTLFSVTVDMVTWLVQTFWSFTHLPFLSLAHQVTPAQNFTAQDEWVSERASEKVSQHLCSARAQLWGVPTLSKQQESKSEASRLMAWAKFF